MRPVAAASTAVVLVGTQGGGGGAARGDVRGLCKAARPPLETFPSMILLSKPGRVKCRSERHAKSSILQLTLQTTRRLCMPHQYDSASSAWAACELPMWLSLDFGHDLDQLGLSF